jgi:hypothetical protein
MASLWAIASIAGFARRYAPTGIDIREGPQIGCITCALCIDACDGVMEKTGRPRGLIDYVTLEDAAREINGQPATPHWKLIWHARTLIYLGIWSAIGAALLLPLARVSTFHRGQQGPQSALYDPVQRRHPQRLCGALEEYGGPPTQDAVGAGRTSGRKMWSEDMSKEMAARDLTRIIPADSTAR